MAVEDEIRLLAEEAAAVTNLAQKLDNSPNRDDLFWQFGIQIVNYPQYFDLAMDLMELKEEIMLPGFRVDYRNISYFSLERPINLFVPTRSIAKDGAYRLLIHNDTDEAIDYDPEQRLVRLELMFNQDGQWEKPKNGTLKPGEIEIAGAAIGTMKNWLEQTLAAA